MPPVHRSVALLAVLLAIGACRPPAASVATGAGATTDQEAAGLVLLSGNATIGLAQVAAARSYDAGVLAFAARERTDHGAMNELLSRLDLEAVEGERARQLRDTSAAQRARLQLPTGRAFDVAYLDEELASHQRALDLLGELQRQVRHPALREHLAALRPVVAAHVAHGEQLRSTLTARE